GADRHDRRVTRTALAGTADVTDPPLARHLQNRRGGRARGRRRRTIATVERAAHATGVADLRHVGGGARRVTDFDAADAKVPLHQFTTAAIAGPTRCTSTAP